MTDKLQMAVDFAKANNLAEIEVDGIKINLTKTLTQPNRVQRELTEDEIKKLYPASPFDSLTEEEILFWSTPYYDEIQEQKDLKQKHIQDDEALHGN